MGKHRFSGLALLLAGSLAALAARADDRTTAEATLKRLAAAPADAALAKDAVERARSALVRADGARKSGDQHHGAMLEALALEWAHSAEELARTAKVERQLVELQKKAADAETKAVRAQALVEQTVARRGRAEEKLRELEAATPASAPPNLNPPPSKGKP